MLSILRVPSILHRNNFRLHKQVTGRQQDKQNLAIIERRLVEERKQKVTLENQLTTEKRRKAEESAALKASTPPPKSVDFIGILDLLLILVD